jgi:hypothetical protein
MVRTYTKRTTEIRDVEADFSGYAEIRAGATIASGTVTAVAGSGLTLGTATVSGAKLQAQSSGGTTKTRYPLKFEATLSTGKKIVKMGRLYVVDLVA